MKSRVTRKGRNIKALEMFAEGRRERMGWDGKEGWDTLRSGEDNEDRLSTL